MPFEIDATNFAAAIDALIEAVDLATQRGVQLGAALVEAEAKSSFGPAHAKGTAKASSQPQSITGTLRRSIGVVDITSAGLGVWAARIAPTVIYGRRIELGFHGTDSLGRNYTNPGQPAYPFLKPGLDKALGRLPDIFTSAWNVALGGV